MNTSLRSGGLEATHAPEIAQYGPVYVVRDDLYPGGTKARFLPAVFEGYDEAVYASPPEGGAQTALARVAYRLGKRARIFVAARQNPHARTREAAWWGAAITSVRPGYLKVVQARAAAYCAETGARLIPFGCDFPGAVEAVAIAASRLSLQPDEVWYAAGSGVLARGLARAWPAARHHAVQVGRQLSRNDVAGAEIHVAPVPFSRPDPLNDAPWMDPHYETKAFRLCLRLHGPGLVVFWNVAAPAAKR